MNKRNIFTTLVYVFVFGAIFSAGFIVGLDKRPPVTLAENVLNKDGLPAEVVDFEAFWKTWNILNEKHIDAGNIENQNKVWGAIGGLASSFDDPYTVFFPPEESKLFEEEVSGVFSGVGMEIGVQDDVLTVISPLKGTPASKAGIRSGDKIVAIDGESTFEMSVDEAVKKIRGPEGTSVEISIVREGEDQPLELSIVRMPIDIPTIETEARDDGVFVIRLFSFSAQSPQLFRGALREFVGTGYSKLILDLRGNPGGYLEAAVDIASWFLPAGKVIVKEEFSGGEEGRVYRSFGYAEAGEDLDFVILVDGGSASASEILAGALSEHGIASLVGTTTFGKGSVQELIPIANGSSLKVTVARWLTPEGVNFSKGGLEPDISVEFTKEDFEAGEDPQLKKAIEYLHGE